MFNVSITPTDLITLKAGLAAFTNTVVNDVNNTSSGIFTITDPNVSAVCTYDGTSNLSVTITAYPYWYPEASVESNLQTLIQTYAAQ
jgi:hypothetical protein